MTKEYIYDGLNENGSRLEVKFKWQSPDRYKTPNIQIPRKLTFSADFLVAHSNQIADVPVAQINIAKAEIVQYHSQNGLR